MATAAYIYAGAAFTRGLPAAQLEAGWLGGLALECSAVVLVPTVGVPAVPR